MINKKNIYIFSIHYVYQMISVEYTHYCSRNLKFYMTYHNVLMSISSISSRMRCLRTWIIFDGLSSNIWYLHLVPWLPWYFGTFIKKNHKLLNRENEEVMGHHHIREMTQPGNNKFTIFKVCFNLLENGQVVMQESYELLQFIGQNYHSVYFNLIFEKIGW